MAITKLMHMKESSQKNPGIHLENSIKYILNPEKTQNERYVGGLGYLGAQKAYEQFLATKQHWGKRHGRQGYHFVLSFPEGEVSQDLAFQITQEFTELYLKGNYDCVFSVHNDTGHVHSHVVFNSVSHEGKKYHYQKGDWEKQIQPVTDQICRKYKISELSIEPDAKEGNLPYPAWMDKRPREMVIKMDLDEAAARSTTYEGFLELLREELHYEIREGVSAYKGEYLSLKLPGKAQATRSYQLKGYSVQEIKERIRYQDRRLDPQPMFLASPAPRIKKYYFASYKKPGITAFQKKYYGYWFFIKRLYHPSYRPIAWKYKKELAHIKKLEQQCLYLSQNGIGDKESLQQKKEDCQEQANVLEVHRKGAYQSYHTYGKEFRLIKEYQELRAKLAEWGSGISDQEYEQIEDRLEEIEGQVPVNEFLEKYNGYREKLKEIREAKKAIQKEKKLIESIEGDETCYEEVLKEIQTLAKDSGRDKPAKKEKDHETKGHTNLRK